MHKIASLLLVFLFSDAIVAQDQIRIPVTDFDSTQIAKNADMAKWETLQFKRTKATHYKLIDTNNDPFIEATSNGSASGLIYHVDVDPQEFSIIEWRWKIDKTNTKSSFSTKDGDDFPVRIYVTFDYSPADLSLRDKIKYFAIKTFSRHKIPLRALTYVWAHSEPKNTISPNPYSKWVHSIAVESGNEYAGSWKLELRDIVDDYKLAFGEEPKRITGVAIMTDTDNTAEMATGYYGDIIFKKSNN